MHEPYDDLFSIELIGAGFDEIGIKMQNILSGKSFSKWSLQNGVLLIQASIGWIIIEFYITMTS